MSDELDPRFTFETFVVGAANRLAAAASRRVAEVPGTTYNPLFLYSASGLGKTHLVTAIGNQAAVAHPDLRTRYVALERLMEDVTAAIEAGDRDAFRSRIAGTGLLLLDDVQFLAGRHRTQEELLRAWDELSARGGQLVLASDRPPQEMDGLDDRLLSRFSGGLIVDMGAPDYETRVAIIRRKAAESTQLLEDGVAEALARISFTNVRELHGALNRVVALQELEDRRVLADEVFDLLGRPAAAAGASDAGDEFGAFIADITEAVAQVIAPAPGEQQLADAILRWEAEGYRTRRLEHALPEALPLAEVEVLVRAFERDVERLREVGGELQALDPDGPELARHEILRDPDRIAAAEQLLAEARERMLPLPGPPAEIGPEAAALDTGSLAARAALAVAERPGERYNPLFVHASDDAASRALLVALAKQIARRHPDLPLAYIEAPNFAAELIRSLEHNRAESWRQRYRRARVLVVERVDALAGTERAQEELFHLFDALQRSGGQLVFSAAAPPASLVGMDERLRTRLAAGLVVEVEEPVDTAVDAAWAAAMPPDPGVRADGAAASGAGRVAAPRTGPGSPPRAGSAAATAKDPASRRAPGEGGRGAAPAVVGGGARLDEWFRSREKVVWEWPYMEDILLADVD